MKKVLLISVRSDVGGGPQHVYDLMKYGAPEKVSFFVAAPYEEPFGEKFKSLSHGFFALPHRRFSIISFIRLIHFCKEKDISIIHSHGLGAGVYSRLLTFFGFTAIHTFHGVHKPKSFLGGFKTFLERIFIHLTKLAVFVSYSERNNALECRIPLHGNDRVIFNGILLPNEIQATSSSLVNIGIISRFDPHKNLSRAIELFSTLIKKYPELRLNIGGDGEEKEKLQQLVTNLGLSHQVEFHGFINEPLKFLEKQDLYFSTSFGEGLPYTVLESMSVGTTPLLSKVSGHVDILGDEYLFDLNDESDFLEKFETLRNRREHPFKDILTKDFEIRTQIDKVINLYA